MPGLRLPAPIGMTPAATAVFSGVTLVLAASVWVGFLNSDLSFDEISDAFFAPANPGQVELVFKVLGSALWGGTGISPSGLLIPIPLFYLSTRWRVAEVALMAEGTGPLQSLRRSWNLSQGFVLRTTGYLLLIFFAMGLVGGVVGMAVDSAVNALFPELNQS